MLITLTHEESQFAGVIGLQRQQMHDSIGRADGKIASDAGYQLHVVGARGELAVSKALAIPWDGKFFQNEDWLCWRKEGHDVGPLEVRTRNLSFGGLLIQPWDKDNSPFILVMGHQHPEYELVGWIWGHEGKKQPFWRSDLPRPCYLIDRQFLRPMAELDPRFP